MGLLVQEQYRQFLLAHIIASRDRARFRVRVRVKARFRVSISIRVDFDRVSSSNNSSSIMEILGTPISTLLRQGSHRSTSSNRPKMMVPRVNNLSNHTRYGSTATDFPLPLWS